MCGRFEEAARRDGHTVLREQTRNHRLRVVYAGEPWKHHRRLRGFGQLQLWMRGNEGARELEIGREEPARAMRLRLVRGLVERSVRHQMTPRFQRPERDLSVLVLDEDHPLGVGDHDMERVVGLVEPRERRGRADEQARA